MTASMSDARPAPQILEALDDVSDGYDVLLCDLWGCYHNGVAPYPAAVAALERFRAKGGAVVLLTNAPRPRAAVRRHLDGMGAPAGSYDAIVSSGDATRAAVVEATYGRRLHIVGPERDAPLYDGADIVATDVDRAEAILCTGLFDDETETPEDYADLIRRGVARDLPFLCANPDIIVDRGAQRLFCAGAIAEAYAAAGGRTVYFGKPHRPIYDLALAEAERLRPGLDRARVLAVGDGLGTDVLGAEQAGLDAIFVTGGLSAGDLGDDPERPDAARLGAMLADKGRSPQFAIGRLR